MTTTDSGPPDLPDFSDGKEPIHGSEPRPLTKTEAAHLARTFLDLQRILKSAAKLLTRTKGATGKNGVTQWMTVRTETVEHGIMTVLDDYAKSQRIGRWLRSIPGVDAVSAAGLISFFDLQKIPTESRLLRIAGLDPTAKLYSAQRAEDLITRVVCSQHVLTLEDVTAVAVAAGRNPRRIIRQMKNRQCRDNNYGTDTPDDEDLGNDWLTRANLAEAISFEACKPHVRDLCWRLAGLLAKSSGHPNGVYGHAYVNFREIITARSEAGQFAELAAKALSERHIGKDADDYVAYAAGKLPDIDIHERAKRHTLRLFLSHFRYRWHEIEFGSPPPKPFSAQQSLERYVNCRRFLAPQSGERNALQLPPLVD